MSASPLVCLLLLSCLLPLPSVCLPTQSPKCPDNCAIGDENSCTNECKVHAIVRNLMQNMNSVRRERQGDRTRTSEMDDAAEADAGSSSSNSSSVNPSGFLQSHCGMNLRDEKFRQRVEGGRVDKRIVGGVESPIGEWPWLVNVMRVYENRTRPIHKCGGSLIHERLVLTAAHCLRHLNNITYMRLYPHKISVRIGEHDLSQDDDDHEDIPLKDFVLHRNFSHIRGQLLVSDIAIVLLQRPATIGRHRNIVCLPDQLDEFPVDSNCSVAGWGFTENGTSALAVRHTTVNPVADSACIEALKNADSEEAATNQLSHGEACFDGTGSFSGACYGDSGSPIVCENNSGQMLLVGFVIYGEKNCTTHPMMPFVGIRVAEFLDWINQTATHLLSA